MYRTRVRHVVFAGLLLGSLVSCGGGSPPLGSGPETVFTADNAWTAPLPPDAELVSPDELRRGVAAGEYRIFGDTALEAQVAAETAQFTLDRAVLDSAATLSPVLRELRDEITAAPTPEGDRALTGDERIQLLGRSVQLRDAAEALRLAGDVDNALAAYELSYALLPETLQAQVPAPTTLRGRPLAEVQAARAALNEMLGAQPQALGAARLEPAAALSVQTLKPGNGLDTDAGCVVPTGLSDRYWFPLKRFLSPVRNQGKRGTCWAFTALGALESREQVQRGSEVNLSEQFLVNKIKEDWDSSTYQDGYNTNLALSEARSRNQLLPAEALWTYNPSFGRPKGELSGEAAYVNSCTGYDGTCSNTAHQSRRVCSTFIVTVCSYVSAAHRGAGVASGRAAQVWLTGQPFPLAGLRQLLANGHVLMASFPVYQGFRDVGADGVLLNYAATRLSTVQQGGQNVTVEVPGNYGGHAALIVGFLSNADLRTPTGTPTVGGGGYFILKNSWGCSWGDGGYAYVPADYVQGRFTSLSVLTFGTERSAKWTQEQAQPGSAEAPKVGVTADPLTADLRVPFDLAANFVVSHSVSKSVTVTVTSDRDGTLYSGPWSTDPNALARPELRRTFESAGTRTVTVQAVFGTMQTQKTFTLNVVNTPPSVRLDAPATVFQGEETQLTALVSDRNEVDPIALCARTTWEITAPDVLVSSGGCQAIIRFGTTGPRGVRAVARDAEGQSASGGTRVEVQPPPANPYPRVRGDVASRDRGALNLCTEAAVAQGATLDLRERGCRELSTQPQPLRYVARVQVENPSGEALTYDWALRVTDLQVERVLNSVVGSAQATYDLGTPGNTAEVTLPCRVTVRVNAPDPERSKSITVWIGRCTYYSLRLN